VIKINPWMLAFAGLPALVGCVRGPNVSSEELPLKKVVVYRNGIAYFERSGKVDAERVTFKMRSSMVGDFLATLAIVERGGSTVRAASFPLEVDDYEPVPVPDPRYQSMLKLPPPPPPKEKDPLREVKLELGDKEHDLLVGYVSETPVWKPSYRVVMQPNGQALLQAWGIIQNLSGEDWEDVELSLVAGAPLAFQSTLGDAVVPPRPIVSDQGEVIAQMPEGTTSLAMPEAAPAPMPPPVATAPAGVAGVAADAMNEAGEGQGYAMSKAAGPTSERAGRGKAVEMMAPASPEELSMGSLGDAPRLNALAAIAVQGGNTRYALPKRVTVPNDSATMVLLLNQSIPGEAVFLFAPDPGVADSAVHPFRVARFTNKTTGLLERGPIAVFESGSFLGEGVVDTLPPDAKATVPFALDRGLAVQKELRYDQRDARLYRIEASRLYIERNTITETTYTMKNGTANAVNMLIKHPRIAETTLYQPPKGTEDNVGMGNALVPTTVAQKAQAKLTVVEQKPETVEIDWLDPLAEIAVQDYLKSGKGDPQVSAKLAQAWAIRGKLRDLRDERDRLTAQQNELERGMNELRQSLRAIEKNAQAGDLRAKLATRLGEASQKYDGITKRLVELGMLTSEQEVRFRDAISEIKLPPQRSE
jgi:hypothetical protein